MTPLCPSDNLATFIQVLGPLLLKRVGGSFSFTEQDLLGLYNTHLAFTREGDQVRVVLMEDTLAGHC